MQKSSGEEGEQLTLPDRVQVEQQYQSGEHIPAFWSCCLLTVLGVLALGLGYCFIAFVIPWIRG